MKTAEKLFVILFRLTASVIVIAASAILLLMLFGIHPYAVKTGSMEPTIPTGSLCFVNHRISLEEIHEGDVIAFRVGELLVTHRAVRIDGEGVTTKGDANNTEDQGAKVTRANYIGKTVFWVPFIGKAVLFIRSGKGRIVAVIAIVLFFVTGLFYDRLIAGQKKTNVQPEQKG